MILLLLKITLVLAAALAAAGALRSSSAAMRHVVCVCGLAGALLMALTLMAPPGAAVLRINALSVASTARIAGGAPVLGLPLLGMLPWLWLAGTAFLMARLIIGYNRLSQLRRKAAAALAPGVLLADVSVPIVAGLSRPVILLPRSANEWPRERTDAALRHERAHLRRNDLWTLLLSHVACAVYWFHPLVWMVAAQLRREQEQACDDAVIRSGFEPACYAEALLAAAHELTSARLIGCPMLTRKTFRSRIARLLGNSMPRTSSPLALRSAAIVFAVAAIAIGLLNGKPQSSDEYGVYRVGKGVRPPRVIFKVDPEYSEQARHRKLAGTVLLSVVIGTDGMAHDVNVVRHLGGGLDEKAVRAITQWRFEPGIKDGKRVKVRAQIEINFRLL